MNRHDFSPERRAASRLFLALAPLALAPLALAPLALTTACGQSAAPEERRIVPHRVPGCEQTSNDGLVLRALGDFAAPSAADVDPTQPADLALPFELRGVEASATSPSGRHGVGYAEPPDDVHLSLWSMSQSCSPIDAVVPPSKGGPSMTAFAEGSAVILAGLNPDQRPQDSAFALVWDTRTGAMIGPNDMNAHRLAFATVTPFGRGALVAGGADPRYLPIRPVKTALVFRDGTFQEPPIALGDDFRAKHGAVALANGETLLVGGEDETGTALSSLLAVAPTTDPPFGQARASGLGSLATARKFPTVLRLANDRVLVAGGVDGVGDPVPTLEWFEADGAPCSQANCPPPQSLFALPDRAFVALPAGGALAVGVRRSTDPAIKDVGDVWWITDDGSLDPLPPLTDGQLGTGRLRLVPAADGSPWLWNGVAWFRFDPWLKTFVVPANAPIDGPDGDLPVIAVDPGLMVWLHRERDGDAGGLLTRVRGFRHDVRGPLARDTPYLLTDRFPPHVVPDRPAGTDITIEDDGLHLAIGSAVGIADATFGDVIIEGKTHSATLPAIKLGATFVVGAETRCPWTSSTATDAGATTNRSFEIRRSGASLQLRVDGVNAAQPCPGGPEGRVSVGLTNLGLSPVVVSELTVIRTSPP